MKRLVEHMLGWFRDSFDVVCVFVLVAVPACLLVKNAAFVSFDSKEMWAQATGLAPLDDWHPILHALLVSVPAWILHGQHRCLMLQALGFSCLVACLFRTLRGIGCGRYICLAVCLCTVLSPASTALVCILWKDTAFGYCALGLSLLVIRALCCGRMGVKSATAFAVLLFLATFLRHNGFFFTFPLLCLFPFAAPKDLRRRIVVAIAVMLAASACYVGAKACMSRTGVLVEGRPGQGLSEAVGLPMTMMTACHVFAPEMMPDDARAFMDSIAPRADLVAEFDGYSFNSVKFPHEQVYRQRINEIGAAAFCGMALRTFAASPKITCRAFLRLTAVAWEPFPPSVSFARYPPVRFERSLSTSWRGWILAAPGFHVLVLLVCFLVGVRRCGCIRSAVLALPVLSYTFLTMLLLSGSDYRFFYITILCSYPLGLALLHCRRPCVASVGPEIDDGTEGVPGGLTILLGEFARYAVVGGVAFLADFGTLVFVKECFFGDSRFGVYVATVFGFLVGLGVNYVLSLWFVFTQKKDRGKGRSVGAFLMFAVIGALGLLWTELGMWIGVELIQWNYMLVKIIVTGAVLAWNYLGRKLLIFNSNGKAKE